jgi:choline dehydrogenase-like flavoprotein
MSETLDCEVLVIGSGPGGATTALMLARAGHDVVMVEEGGHFSIDSAPSYSIEEMDQKYRNGGLNSTFGKTNVTYLEGRCVGGGSEINAALYHRPKVSTVEGWAERYAIQDFDLDELWTHFEWVEEQMSVSRWPQGVGPASQRIKKGADAMGWSSQEVTRFWKYSSKKDRKGRRQSMTETLVPRAVDAGTRLHPHTKVERLVLRRGMTVAADATRTDESGRKHPVRIRFQTVFVCGGAVQTALLLRRSGIRDRVGDSLCMHPMLRIAARFPDAFNDPGWGVPVQQIDQFKPEVTLGCSHSSLPHIALWLTGEGVDKKALLAEWDKMAVFYVAAVGQGRGRIRHLPLVHEPLIRFPMLDADMARMGEGLYNLGQAVFAAGATEVFSPIEGGAPYQSAEDMRSLCQGIPHGKVNISTIHLFSSVPMGEAPMCPVDSWGRLRGHRNLYINDASLLPESPGVNPQGTVMAVAHRNAQHWLDGRSR